MARVVWPDVVIDQLIQITAYIQIFDPRSAERIGSCLFELGESLATFPHRGRPGPDGTRALLAVFPYVLTYEVIDDSVIILDVRHGARERFNRCT